MTEDRSVLNTLAGGTGINLLGFIARLLIVTLHSLVAARLYGPVLFGVYSLFVATVAILSMFSQAGMARTLVRTVSISLTNGDNAGIKLALRYSLLISLPLAALVAVSVRLAAQPIAVFFGDEALVEPLRVFGLAVPALTAATLLGAFTQGFKRMFDKVFVLEIVRGLVELTAAVLCVVLGYKQLGLTFSYTLSVVVAAGLMIIFARRNLSRMERFESAKTAESQPFSVGALASYSLPVWLLNMIVVLSRRAPVLLIGWGAGAAYVGVFALIQRLIMLATSFLTSIGTMLSPMVSELSNQGREIALAQLYRSATRWTLIVCTPILLYLALFSEEILSLFGALFAAGATALSLLAFASLANVATGPAGVLLIMSGHARISALNEILNLGVILLGGYLLIPRYQLIGAVIALSLAIIVVNSLRVLQVWRLMGIHPYQLRLVKIFLAACAASGVVIAFRWYASDLELILFLLLGGLFMSVAYFGALVSLRLEPEDMRLLELTLRRLQNSGKAVPM